MTHKNLEPSRLNSLRQLARKLELEFQDYELLNRALSHSSLSNEGLPNYERLEFLGDAVLGFLVAEDLYKRQPEIPEGELTERRARLVSRKPLAQVCQVLELSQYLRVGKGLTEDAISSPRIQADLVEAVLAAIYLDRGIHAARQFVTKYLLEHFRNEPSITRPSTDAKTRLNRFAQSQNLPTPIYRVVETSGPDHQLRFRVAVTIAGKTATSSTVRSKQEGEQEAAAQAWELLHREQLEQDGPVFFPDSADS